MRNPFFNIYSITHKRDTSKKNTSCNIYLSYDGENKLLPHNHNVTNYNFIFNYIPTIVVPYTTKKTIANDVG